jgi:hypothetical protein
MSPSAPSCNNIAGFSAYLSTQTYDAAFIFIELVFACIAIHVSRQWISARIFTWTRCRHSIVESSFVSQGWE